MITSLLTSQDDLTRSQLLMDMIIQELYISHHLTDLILTAIIALSNIDLCLTSLSPMVMIIHTHLTAMITHMFLTSLCHTSLSLEATSHHL